jgi:hypothetical protein
MRRSYCWLAVTACLLLAGSAAAQGTAGLVTATGLVEKADKDSVTVRPRGPDGKFGKSVVLKLTGTSKVSTLGQRKSGGKVTLTQRDTDAKDLQKNQAIAVIYTTASGEPVLLAAVVQAGK